MQERTFAQQEYLDKKHELERMRDEMLETLKVDINEFIYKRLPCGTTIREMDEITNDILDMIYPLWLDDSKVFEPLSTKAEKRSELSNKINVANCEKCGDHHTDLDILNSRTLKSCSTAWEYLVKCSKTGHEFWVS